MSKRFLCMKCVLALAIGIMLLLAGCSFYNADNQEARSDAFGSADETGVIELPPSTGPVTTDTVPQKPEPAELNMGASKNADGATVFAISAEDFIENFNYIYWKSHAADYLTSFATWTQLEEKSPFYEYEALCYRFSADEQVWTMPTLSIYIPESGEGIYELMLTFDDHGYQESMYQEFKEMCRCALAATLPKLDDDAIADLYADLYVQAIINFGGNSYPDTSEKRPGIEAMYCYEGIGLYGYYGAGTVNICIVPLTPDDSERLGECGIEIRNIE